MFGANIPQAGVAYEDVKRTVLECERHGFDFVWISDHLEDFIAQNSYLECWTTLSAIAEATQKIRLCTLVLNNQFRHPSLLAKMAATLDTISKGRLDFGIGAGWLEKECVSNGIQFPSASVRIEQLEEAIKLIRELWRSDNVSFAGKYYSLTSASCNPKPVQIPYPPIWVGVMKSGTRMLEMIAKYADVWTISSLYLPQPKEYQRIRLGLDEICRKIGRNPSLLRSAVGVGCVVAKDEAKLREKVQKFKPVSISTKNYTTKQMRIEGTPDQCIEALRVYAELGVTRFVMNFPDIVTADSIKLFGENVIRAFE